MPNWIDLFEYRMFPAMVGEHERCMIYQNPTLSDSIALVGKKDYRGLSDGKNFFIWDASAMIHGQAAECIAQAGKWEGNFKDDDHPMGAWFLEQYGYREPEREWDLSCYLHCPHVADPSHCKDEWMQGAAMGMSQIEFAPGMFIVIVNEGKSLWKTVRAFTSLVRNVES